MNDQQRLTRPFAHAQLPAAGRWAGSNTVHDTSKGTLSLHLLGGKTRTAMFVTPHYDYFYRLTFYRYVKAS